MDCAWLVDRLEAFLDGSLSADEQRAADAHLVTCSQCREVTSAMPTDLRFIGVESPPDLTESILARTSGSVCRRAAFYNLALDGVEGIELPDDMNFELPSFGGSIAGGVALMVLGGILLSNTLFDFSLAWVEDLWPVAPIVFGAYLVVKARQERHEQD